MNRRILNRQFQHPADGFYQIEATGFHPNARAKVVQVIDDKAVAAICANFNRDAATGALRHGHEMLIDHEHFKHDGDKETIAYGWMEDAQARPDGIYARNRWTATGRPAVDGGDYRFFSTEYDDTDPVNYEKVDAADVPEAMRNKYAGWRFIRPLVLTGLTLTNQFNNRGQKPITNRFDKLTVPRGEAILPDKPANSPAGAQADIQNRKTTMKHIAVKLGMSADSPEEEITGELARLMNRAETAEATASQLTTENATLKNRIAVLDNEQIDADFDSRGISDQALRNKLKPVLAGMKNRAERVEFLGLLPAHDSKGAARPLTNRGGARTPDGGMQQPDSADEKELAAKITNRAQSLKGSAPGRTFDSCWKQAQREVLQGK